ncbi:MAG: hypothetical protein AAFW69_08030 [Pseudomonadota bacterium]
MSAPAPSTPPNGWRKTGSREAARALLALWAALVGAAAGAILRGQESEELRALIGIVAVTGSPVWLAAFGAQHLRDHLERQRQETAP